MYHSITEPRSLSDRVKKRRHTLEDVPRNYGPGPVTSHSIEFFFWSSGRATLTRSLRLLGSVIEYSAVGLTKCTTLSANLLARVLSRLILYNDGLMEATISSVASSTPVSRIKWDGTLQSAEKGKLHSKPTTEQEADRGPQAGSPLGVVVATWPVGQTLIGVLA